MEPDPAKNIERDRRSQRRISSILKAPRKSSRCSDSEQQENVVECVKPVERRSSRRVSFAPANDVLLFSKDVGSSSPTRNPFQEIIPTDTSTQNSGDHREMSEDGTQQIVGMETSLCDLTQRDNVHFNFGEKTLMFNFSTNEPFMDMTQSHTVNIANDPDLPGDVSLQIDALPSSKGTLFVDAHSTEKRKATSAPTPCADLSFEKFLESLSKPTSTCGNPADTKVTRPTSEDSTSSLAPIKTQSFDKENQALTTASNMTRKSLLNSSKQTKELPAHLCPEDLLKIDMTGALGGQGASDESSPFQWLFPSQDMYAHADKGQSEMMNTKEKPSSPDKQNDKISLIHPSLLTGNPRHAVCTNEKGSSREKTIVFSADEECMDFTQSHTVNLACRGKMATFIAEKNVMDVRKSSVNVNPCEQPNSTTFTPLLTQNRDGTVNFSANDGGMDFTQCLTGNYKDGLISPVKLGENETENTDKMQQQCPSPVLQPSASTMAHFSSKTKQFSSRPSVGSFKPKPIAEKNVMDMRKSPVNVDPCEQPHSTTFTPLLTQSTDGTVHFSANDGGMDFTQCFTENYKDGLISPGKNSDNKIQLQCPSPAVQPSASTTAPFSSKTRQHLSSLSMGSFKPKPIAEENAMDMRTSHAVNVNPCTQPNPTTFTPLLTQSTDGTVNFSENDGGMDFTQCFTENYKDGLISPGKNSDNKIQQQCPSPVVQPSASTTAPFCSNKHMSGLSVGIIKPKPIAEKNVMDMRKSQVNVESCEQPNSTTFTPLFTQSNDGTVNFSANDGGMDFTQCLTGNYKDGLISPEKKSDYKIQQQCPSPAVQPSALTTAPFSSKTKQLLSRLSMGSIKAKPIAEKNVMDMRKSPVNAEPCEQPNSTTCTPLFTQSTDGTVHFSANDGGMDFTQCLTGNYKDELISPVKLRKNETENTEDEIQQQCPSPAVQPSASTAAPFSSKTKQVLSRVLVGSIKPKPNEEESAMDVRKSPVNVDPCEQPNSTTFTPLLTHTTDGTVHFSANDGGMDFTQCLTGNYKDGLISPVQLGENETEDKIQKQCLSPSVQPSASTTAPFSSKTKQLLSSLSVGSIKPKPIAEENVMDMRKSPVNVEPCEKPNSTTFTPLLTQSTDGTVNFSANDEGMEFTQCFTGNYKDGLISPVKLGENETENTEDKIQQQSPSHAVQLSALTMAPFSSKEGQLLSSLSVGSIKPKPIAEDNAMDMRQSPVNVDHCEQPNSTTCAHLLKQNTDGTVNFSANDGGMDFTQCLTGNYKDGLISPGKLGENETENTNKMQQQCPSPVLQPSASTMAPFSSKTKQFLSRPSVGSFKPKPIAENNAIDMRKSHVNVDPCEQPNSTTFTPLLTQSTDGTVHFSANDEGMDFTQCLTGNYKDGLISPVKLGENETENTENKIQQCPSHAVQPSASTMAPFSSKTKQLFSRLSVGSFKPKLPQKRKPKNLNKSKSEPTMGVSVLKQPSNFDLNVSDIFDEELASCDDISETLDPQSPQKTPEKEYPPLELMFDTVPVDVEFEDSKASQRQKRSFPEIENVLKSEKRMKGSNETAEMPSQCESTESDAKVPVGARMTQTIDSSNNSSTASSRCETTYESTFKQSLFESQLEDYVTVHKNLEDGTITVLEFFKLCNIDFVIHNPRQSIRPGTFFSGSEATTMDLLKDKYISRPKQMVYETDVNDLTEKVEKLKVRMGDLNKPLKAVNTPLWEGIRYCSEKELKSFCVTLKERNKLFKKASKAQCHEMKEVLYSNLVQANLEEQQKLRGTIGRADEMIKTLDDCISELEKELAAVVEEGFENKPSLKSLQEEMKKISETSTDNERQIFELESQKKQNVSQVKRLKTETSSLEHQLDTLSMLIEWKLKEKTNDGAIYTFLYDTMYLQLTYEKSTDNDVSSAERKIASIDFQLELNVEKSQSHARLVHALVSQYVHGASDWVKEYPTSAHVSTLLRDVSLVVSHCRMLGEECRQLKLWGSLPFDILDISCMDTQVRIVFSSLRKRSKFEVVFGVSLVKHLYVLKVDSFNNKIGNITIHQLQEIVESFTPAKKVLTKIIKKIHQTLLC